MRSAHHEVVTLDSRYPARDIQELFTEAEKRHLGLCIEAEARGDADAALVGIDLLPFDEGRLRKLKKVIERRQQMLIRGS